MANYFDQFDTPEPEETEVPGNYFDRFDSGPPPEKKEGGPPPDKKEGNFFDRFDPRPQPPQPEAEEGLGTAVRHFFHALPGMATGLATGAAIGAVRGIPGGVPGMLISGGAGLLAGGAEAYLQSKATEKYWPEEAERLQRGEEAHPYMATAGNVAAAAPFVGVGGLTREALKATAASRAAVGGVAGGLDVGQQLAFTGEVDPGKAALNVAGGALFGGQPTRLGQRLGLRETPGAEVQHGEAGPKAAPGTSEAKPPPVKDEGVGDPQNKPSGSETYYGKSSRPQYAGAQATEARYGDPGGITALPPHEDPALAQALRGEPIKEPTLAEQVAEARAENARLKAAQARSSAPPAGAEPAPTAEAPSTAQRPEAPPETVGGLLPESRNKITQELAALARAQEQIAALEPARPAEPAAPREPPPVQEPAPPPAAEPSIESLRPAYDDIKAQQGGIGTVYISDLIRESGLPRDAVHAALTKSAQAGEVSLNASSLADSRLTEAQRSAAIEVPGERPFTTVTFKAAPREAVPPPASPQPERGPLAREVAPQHMPWYDRGYEGMPRGGNEAEQAAWDRGANDRMQADRAKEKLPAPPKQAPAPAAKAKPDAVADALAAIQEEALGQPKPPPAPEAPAKYSIAKDADTGKHVLFRGDEPVGEFANRGAALKALNRAKISDAAAKRAEAHEPRPEEPEGVPRPLGAAATGESGATPPATPRVGWSDRVRPVLDKLFGIGRDVQMKASPMATGDRDSMAAATDFASIMRWINHEWSTADSKIEKQFSPEARKRIWDAMDEESVMRQRGETSEHMGIATLSPEERALADSFQPRAQAGWEKMRELGMVKGEGLPYWTPRMMAFSMEAGEAGPRTLDRIGANLRTTTPHAKHRKYEFAEDTEAAMKKHFGEEAGIVRDVRVLPLAIAKMERAIAGREFVNKIREIAKAAGLPDAVGDKPGPGWFTITDHPAMYETRVRPRMEEADTATYREAVPRAGGVEVPPAQIPLFDRNGNPVLNYERVPIWLPNQMEGPLRAVLTKPPGRAYSAAMELKGKTMGLIMNSPLIHLQVEMGRMMPAMPGKMLTGKIFFDGNRAKNDRATMREAIVDGNLDPIGKRFFNQDIHSIMESPTMTPGRSWTSQVLGFVPGLFDPKAGIAVKRAIDRAGDFWHNTLLWDRIADLQAGYYVNRRDDLIAQGKDRLAAVKIAAHEANRYAGALPMEAMSDSARKIANMLLFSRSFTLGNLGVMKDAFKGLPRNVEAQLLRDVGPEAAKGAMSAARRKAMSVVMLDIGLMYVGNSLLQSGLNVLRGDKTVDQEMRDYVTRLSDAMKEAREDPLNTLNPRVGPKRFAEHVSATHENEPGKQDRVFVGYTKEGTAIYARNPVGKIGEEFVGYATGPLDMLRRKLGTVARPLWQILANDKGFGRKVYDPNADTTQKEFKNAAKMAALLVEAQTPEGQIRAAADLAKGEGDTKLNLLQTLGPLAGTTFSRGAPGGVAEGERLRAREKHQYEVNEAMPEIRRMIQRGDEEGARKQMHDLGIPPGLQNFYVRTTKNPALRLTPRAVQDFNRYATPEERERFQRARQRQIPLTPELVQ